MAKTALERQSNGEELAEELERILVEMERSEDFETSTVGSNSISTLRLDRPSAGADSFATRGLLPVPTNQFPSVSMFRKSLATFVGLLMITIALGTRWGLRGDRAQSASEPVATVSAGEGVPSV